MLWRDGELRDLGGDSQPSWIGPHTQVSLWHPLGQDPDAILVWRDLLEFAGICQPFKQAHRETYAPTQDERGAAISTRFAGHVLRQHQLHALCQARGWANTLRLSVDDNYPPATLALPRHGLRAELWIEGVGHYGDDTTSVGTYLYVISEELRFHRLDDPPSLAHAVSGGYRQAASPLPLARVPAFVFSEVMRDVELFVSVSSLANDPSWDPGDREGPLAHYWDDFVFGPLSGSGRTRRAVLARMLPALDIAKDCELRERVLAVRGPDGQIYEVHLGSANVRDADGRVITSALRERARATGKTGAPALPFEGDATLVAILTRATQLARGG